MVGPITIRYPSRPARRSLATARVADLFGLSAGDEPEFVAAVGLTVDLRPGDVCLVTGPSGSGKSSLLRAIGRRVGAVDAGALELPDVPLVDALPGPVDGRLAVLSGCGLGEARLAVRTPAELSDGQRYRFRIAYALSLVIGHSSLVAGHSSVSPGAGGGELRTEGQGPRTILLDEFAAVLDRPLAKVVAFNVRKLADRTGVGVLAATTHDDLAADLDPDVRVVCRGDGDVTAERRGEGKKKDGSASPTTSGCRTAPGPTGRTSLGGITAATTWRSSGG